MADAIDDVIDQQTNRLLDNIIGSNINLFVDHMSIKTKDYLVKDYIDKQVKNMIDKLNTEFIDVKFSYDWVYLEHYTYNCDEVSNETFEYDDFEHIQHLGEEPVLDEYDLRQIGLKIYFYWNRVCSLGCQHLTKRYLLINIPKVIDFTSYIRLGMPVRTFVKEFIPDFFYDPTKPSAKKGRPRKT
jgi:hypothetical protein